MQGTPMYKLSHVVVVPAYGKVSRLMSISPYMAK